MRFRNTDYDYEPCWLIYAYNDNEEDNCLEVCSTYAEALRAQNDYAFDTFIRESERPVRRKT